MGRIAYCFDCKLEIEIFYLSQPCPRCGGNNWTFMTTQLRTDLSKKEWEKERKRIRELQDRHFREKGDEREQ